jgi:diguanylate cyclase (GGDEF)-like protein/PAS domain S-box-containing protein
MDNLSSSVFVGILDLDGILRYANRAALNAAGLKARDVVGERFENTPWWSVSEVSRFRLREAIGNAVAGRGSRFDAVVAAGAGKTLTVDCSLEPVLGPTPEDGYLVVSAHDVTELRRTERSLRATQVAVDHAQEALLQVAAGGEIRYANDAACRLLGYEREELLMVSASDLRADMQPGDWPTWWSELKSRGSLEMQTFARRRGGCRVPVVVRASHIEHDGWECASLHLVDLSERVTLEERIRHVAGYDLVTGLPNRGRFCDLLEQRLLAADASRSDLAVLVVGLDRFRLINDSLGQLGGDQILAEVARRLSRCVSEDALVGRLSADEFALTLVDEGPAVAFTTQAASRVLAALSTPIRAGEEDVYVSCGIGIALRPGTGERAEELITNAAIAMHEIKRRDGGPVQLFTPRNRMLDRERLRLEADLHRATERAEFAVFYQPRVDAQRGSVLGFEALLRWPRPDGSWVAPARFIPVAEETGLIHPIGAWVLRSAMEQAKVWQDRIGPATSVSVNLSARQFRQPDLASFIAELLEDTGLEPQRLELELTETMLISDVEQAIRSMHALKDLGLRLSLDDFGTGYSSLSYLRRFPIDTLKIDQVFVQQMDTDDTSVAIVDTIIAMAHRLGLSVTAEGVETERQLAMLRERGCKEIQGFLIARPMPVGQIRRFLDARDPRLLSCAP